MTALAVPSPSPGLDVHGLCQQIEARLPEITDVGTLRDTAARLSAIDRYIAATSTEGRAQVVATIRRIELRVGQVLGPVRERERTDLSQASDSGSAEIPKDDRARFRAMAAHPEVVERIIAESTDEAPATRSRILDVIADIKAEARAHHAAERAEQQAWVKSLGPVTDPEGDRLRQRVHMACINLSRAMDRLEEFTPTEVRKALDTDIAHVSADNRAALARALETVRRYQL